MWIFLNLESSHGFVCNPINFLRASRPGICLSESILAERCSSMFSCRHASKDMTNEAEKRLKATFVVNFYRFHPISIAKLNLEAVWLQ